MTPHARADALLEPLRRAASLGYIGEAVSQLDHALQAADLAARAGADDELVLAALFHDLGHLIAPEGAEEMDGLGVAGHESIAARALIAAGCSERVAALVEAHVQAKRYLCWKNPGYLAALSDASRGTLAFQGGPMSDEEAARFEGEPDLRGRLAVRAWDDRAKDPAATPPGIEAHRDRLIAHLAAEERPFRELTAPEVERWRHDQYLQLPGVFRGAALSRLRGWIDEVSAWPERPGRWMKYFEKQSGSDQRMLCRVENFLPYHDGLRAVIESPQGVLHQLLDEPSKLFKEKINFKLPGGAGFTAHQDAPAFGTFGQTYHVTMLVAVDPQHAKNGGLEVSDPARDVLPQGNGGVLHPEVEARLPWRPLQLAAGDVVFFDSYLPHRSGPNRSDTPRRALYITYNRASQGDVRDAYFADKRRHFPPECEREPGVDYASRPSPYNLGNPIR